MKGKQISRPRVVVWSIMISMWATHKRGRYKSRLLLLYWFFLRSLRESTSSEPQLDIWVARKDWFKLESCAMGMSHRRIDFSSSILYKWHYCSMLGWPLAKLNTHELGCVESLRARFLFNILSSDLWVWAKRFERLNSWCNNEGVKGAELLNIRTSETGCI